MKLIRTIDDHAGRAVVGCIGYRLIYEQLLSYNPPHGTPPGQLPFKPAGELPCSPIGIDHIGIVKTDINPHLCRVFSCYYMDSRGFEGGQNFTAFLQGKASAGIVRYIGYQRETAIKLHFLVRPDLDDLLHRS